MVTVKTFETRRLEAVSAIREGVERLQPRLADYARLHGGRFILFGSTISGEIHDQSDVDIIADFPKPVVFDACRFADEACIELGLAPDVRPAIWTAPEILRRALDTGRLLP